MSKFALSLVALFAGLLLVGLSYAWPAMQTNWTDDKQEVLADAASKWHASTDPHSGDSHEAPAARAARVGDLKAKYLVQRAALVEAQAAVVRTVNVLYYSGIALGAVGLLGVIVSKQNSTDEE